MRETLIRDGSKAETRRQLDLPAMQLQPSDTVLMLDDPRLLVAARQSRRTVTPLSSS